jgi:uncharacterized protein DUF4124
MRMKVAVVLGSALSTLPFVATAQGLYKCTKDGRTVYQDGPCDTGAKQDRLREPAPTVAAPSECPTHLIPNPPVDPKTGMESAAGRRYRMGLEMVIEVDRWYEACSTKVPEFRTRFDGAYGQWQAKFQSDIAAYRANGNARKMVECARGSPAEQAAMRSAPSSPELVRVCLQTVGPLLERLVRDGLPQ